jgi:hypothetical protein
MAGPPAGTDLEDNATDQLLPTSNPWAGRTREFQQAVDSLLKNTHFERFDPRSGAKHTVFGAFWSFSSQIRRHFRLSADFFNKRLRFNHEGFAMDIKLIVVKTQGERSKIQCRFTANSSAHTTVVL